MPAAYGPRMSRKRAQPIRSLRFGVKRGRAMTVDIVPGPPLGPGVVTADLDTVLAALQQFDPDLSWKKARDRILPMLPRVRPYPGRSVDLVRAMVPPGILVSFGIDLGPAITFVGPALLERWKVQPSDLWAAALSNVRRLAAGCHPSDLVRDQVADVPVAVLQSGLGIASTLILVPEAIEPLFGPGPHLLLAPMRDVLLALPPEVDREFAAWLATEWEALDPNCLHLGAFRYVRGTIAPEPLDEAARA